ncbi:hypothetical protein RclHR1_05720010 [Rhizophagus clarus]|uniref:Cytochrome P450 n=1 Tax=Rhizophagus clarus TaxID=94130 RepID=A0A2Z6SG65_9GLOM|nr:hypothetical protein RclHR1_05720010 [Rhizophagus clarus]GET03157.1 cytochrome P450 [Rhizophagus clarus]
MISTITSTFSSFGILDIFYLFITFIILYVSRYYYNFFIRPNPLPGPLPIPIFGNIHQKSGYEFNDWLMLLHKRYGDMFEVNLSGQRTIILCNTELIENMNITSTKTKYPIRFIVTEGFIEYGINGTGIVNNTDLKSWKYNREFFTQAIMTPSFNHQAVECTNKLWDEMETYWNNLGENYELNLIKWMHRFSNEMIFIISTGVKNNSVASYYYTLVPDNDLNEKEKEKIRESEDFIRSLEMLLRGAIYFYIFNRFMRHYVPFIRGKANSLLRNRDYLYEKIYNIIKERRIEIENTPLDKPLRHDMLTSFITANTPRDINTVRHSDTDADLLRPMTDREIFGNILDAMGGGTDTTANLFCFVAYYLGRYPEVKQRLRQELDEVLGKDITKPITYKEIDELNYCDAVVKEVYRHFPVAFSLGRVSAEKDEVGGYIWPEGTSYSILYCAIMKRKDYWTEPEKFDPDRFYKIDESDKYLLERKHAKTAFSIFGGGIRACPGRKLAMIELKCLMASIYRKYDIELVDKNAPINYESGFITGCKELRVKIKPRELRG